MRKKILSLAILIGAVAGAFGQSTIAYFNGPAFPVPAFEVSRTLDLNQDGIVDFNFAGGTPICTQDIPISACAWRFSVDGNGINQQLWATPLFLGVFSPPVLLQPFGAWITSNPPPPTLWGDPRFGSTLATYFFSQRQPSRWLFPLGTVGIGYLGVRFHAADGLHYGWIRVRLPRSDVGADDSTFEFTPVVMEWAYETRPETPIRVGATGREDETTEFTVDFRNPDGTPHGINADLSTGRVQLLGDSLRYEIRAIGSHESAELRGPSPPRSNARPVASLAHPRIDVHFFSIRASDPNTLQVEPATASVFFGELALSRSQIIQLKRGAYHVSVGDAAVIGRVVPAVP